MIREASPRPGFVAELRRRHVLRVVGFYAIGVWLILQIGNVVSGPFSVPNWMMIALIIAVVAGFPIVAVLAWVFDLTPDGLVRTGPRTALGRLDEFEEAITDQPRLWIDIVIIGVLLAIVAYLLVKPGAGARNTLDPSIAVLPFIDLSERRNQAYFSEGIAAELLAELVRVEGLHVAGTSGISGVTQRDDLRELGRQLGVATILDGSVRRDGDRVRIVAQLIDVETGFHLWSETYDRMLDDIFAVQNDISRSILRALRVRLAAPYPSIAAPTEDLDAYDAYLRGRDHLRGPRLRDNLSEAIRFFEQALRIDPRFALANAGLCSAYWELYDLDRDAAGVERALSACQVALARDDTLPEVHNALGWLLVGTGNPRAASDHFERALRLGADRNADALRGLGIVAERGGDAAAAETLFKRAVELEPNYWRNHVALGSFLFNQARYSEALAVVENALRRTPPNTNLLNLLGGAHLAMGAFEQAAAAFVDSLRIGPNYPAYANAGTTYFYLGRYAEARDVYRDALNQYPNNYELRSFLADACRLLPDGAECAHDNYRAALSLGSEFIAVNPSDVVAVARIGLIHAHLGEWDDARRYLDDAQRRGGTSGNVLRILALAAVLERDRDRAMALLQRARATGYPAHMLTNHPDFAVLARDRRFTELAGADVESQEERR